MRFALLAALARLALRRLHRRGEDADGRRRTSRSSRPPTARRRSTCWRATPSPGATTASGRTRCPPPTAAGRPSASGSAASSRTASRLPASRPTTARSTPSCAPRSTCTACCIDAPHDAAAPGQPYELMGRAALAAGSPVTIEAADGSTAATTTVDAAGAFHATVSPRSTTSFRAVSGAEATPPVQLLVLDRKVKASSRVHGRRVVVKTRVLPAAHGATVVLQMHLKERFGWWPVRTAKLDAHSRARFAVKLRHSRARTRRAHHRRRRDAAGAQLSSAAEAALASKGVHGAPAKNPLVRRSAAPPQRPRRSSCSMPPGLRARPRVVRRIDRRPNIVFVLTDDLSWDLLRFMPHVRQLQRDGMTFRQFMVSDSLCCSSRATIFTGEFPHDTRRAQQHRRRTAATTPSTRAARSAERRDRAAARRLPDRAVRQVPQRLPAVPRGRGSRAGASGSARATRYDGFGYEESDNGQPTIAGYRPRDYVTNVLARHALRFIRGVGRARPVLRSRSRPTRRTRRSRPRRGTGRCSATCGFRAARAFDAPSSAPADVAGPPPAAAPRRRSRTCTGVPRARAVGPGGRPHDRPAARRAAGHGRRAQHVHRVRVRQRLPPRPAPADAPASGRRSTPTSACR